ncbi:MAG: hypothetical protein WKF40_05710 [Thermoleophilaceae bacterium]
MRGRGGAGFAMGKKASFIPKGTMDKYLCCNADESEPGTFKDRLLMQKNPHQLVEGCIIGSTPPAAQQGVHLHPGRVRDPGQDPGRRRGGGPHQGLLRRGDLRSQFDLDLVVHRGQGAYICGEESALLDGLEGKRGNPRLSRPSPPTRASTRAQR